MLETPLRVGVCGAGKTARGVASQIESTDGMDLAWRSEEDPSGLFKNEPIDVFVEASGDIALAAETSLLAIAHNAHIVLTEARVDVAVGLTLQAHAYESGIIVTSDAGTPHGTLASMIQEAHIMGFETIQAGQIAPLEPSAQLHYEMAALANGFGFRPPEEGMNGPEVNHADEIITSFKLDSYGDIPRVDFVRSSKILKGLYLIAKPKNQLTEEQSTHLKECQLGEGPYFLFRRNFPLGYFETPKAILGAAAGQAILTPGYPTCEVYAHSTNDGLKPSLLPYSEDLVPHFLLPENDTSPEKFPTLQNTTLPDSPLTHLWVEQRKIIESQSQA